MEIENFEIQVRAALGADNILIPDDVISLPIYQGKALRFLAGIADYDSLDEAQQQSYRNAAVYKTALLLIPYFRAQYKKVEQSPHLKEESFEMDWPALEVHLKASLDEELAAVDAETSAGGFSFFGITNQRAGGCQ